MERCCGTGHAGHKGDAVDSSLTLEVNTSEPALKARIAPIVHYITYIGILAHLGFIPLFLVLDVPYMALFNVGSVLAWVVARIANLEGRPGFAVTLIAFEVVTHAVLAVMWTGWESGFHCYLLALIPVLMFNDKWRTGGAVAATLAVAIIYVALRAAARQGPLVVIESRMLEVVQYSNIAVLLAALIVISLFFRFASETIETRMETFAMTDALTGLPNRRCMLEQIARERSRAARGAEVAAIIIADIDHFKRINDRYGHEAGDAVLKGISRVLRGQLRQHDTVARWGGEEFLFLLPDTNEVEAGRLAERLRFEVMKARIGFQDMVIAVTMTFGVSSMSAQTDFDSGLRSADRALYHGKVSGRNLVVCYEPTAHLGVTTDEVPHIVY